LDVLSKANNPKERLDRMLSQRLLTALFLIPLVVLAIFCLGNGYFALVAGLIFLVAANEWEQLMGLNQPWRGTFMASFAVLAGALWLSDGIIAKLLLLLCGLWWLYAFFWVKSYPKGLPLNRPLRTKKFFIGLILLLPGWYALVTLQTRGQTGPALLLSVLVMIWAADTGAYFAGRSFGRHKLAPRVSPGKTWEGLVGGVIAGVAAAAMGFICIDRLLSINLLAWFGFIVLMSVVGDLTISMFKRHSGMKDSGHLLPGHGGILDRIDSLLAAAPLFLIGVDWQRWAG